MRRLHFPGMLSLRAALAMTVAVALSSVGATGCSSSAQTDDEVGVVEEGLTSLDVSVVGDLDFDTDPGPIAYSNPTKYRALSLTSITMIEELEVEITAEGGEPRAWIVDESFRALATSVTVATGARVHLRKRLSASHRYYLLLREASFQTTVFHVRCPRPRPPPPPPPPECRPETCANLGKNCGAVADGCGASLDCGACSVGSKCTANQCVAEAGCKDPWSGSTIAPGGLCNWAQENSNQGHPEGICTMGGCHQGCFIDGQYYPVGRQNPRNPCQICSPTSSLSRRVGWTDVPSGYESYYPTCHACVDNKGLRNISSGAPCYDHRSGRAGTCAAGTCTP